MIFHRLDIPGACIVDLERREDERGFFARGWCWREFADQGFGAEPVQMNISFNRHSHTLRGFHYQVAPHQEDKLIRCVRGAVHDVMVDLRPDSPTYLRHVSVELSGVNQRALLVPKGCANAFLTLEDATEVTYLVSEFYAPAYERGLRWDDPALDITWPAQPAVISQKDQAWPDFRPERVLAASSADQE